MSPRVRAVPRVVLEDEVIAEIAELPPQLTSDLRHIDGRERRKAVRIARKRAPARVRIGRTSSCRRLSESQWYGERGEELPSIEEHGRLSAMLAPGVLSSYGSRRARREHRSRAENAEIAEKKMVPTTLLLLSTSEEGG